MTFEFIIAEVVRDSLGMVLYIDLDLRSSIIHACCSAREAFVPDAITWGGPAQF